MSELKKDACPTCGMQGVPDPNSCPNCNANIPKVRKGDLSTSAYILVILGFIVLGIIAGLSGLEEGFFNILIIVIILFGVIAGVVNEIRKRR